LLGQNCVQLRGRHSTLLSFSEPTFEPIASLKHTHQTIDEMLAKRDQTKKDEKQQA
jgi:hypothetical protein